MEVSKKKMQKLKRTVAIYCKRNHRRNNDFKKINDAKLSLVFEIRLVDKKIEI